MMSEVPYFHDTPSHPLSSLASRFPRLPLDATVPTIFPSNISTLSPCPSPCGLPPDVLTPHPSSFLHGSKSNTTTNSKLHGNIEISQATIGHINEYAIRALNSMDEEKPFSKLLTQISTSWTYLNVQCPFPSSFSLNNNPSRNFAVVLTDFGVGLGCYLGFVRTELRKSP